MGMFNYVRCDFRLPDAPRLHVSALYQTKSIDGGMGGDSYHIDAAGGLWEIGEGTLTRSRYSGTLFFYISRTPFAIMDEYNAEFIDGQMRFVEVVKPRKDES